MGEWELSAALSSTRAERRERRTSFQRGEKSTDRSPLGGPPAKARRRARRGRRPPRAPRRAARPLDHLRAGRVVVLDHSPSAAPAPASTAAACSTARARRTRARPSATRTSRCPRRSAATAPTASRRPPGAPPRARGQPVLAHRLDTGLEREGGALERRRYSSPGRARWPRAADERARRVRPVGRALAGEEGAKLSPSLPAGSAAAGARSRRGSARSPRAPPRAPSRS